MVWVIEWTYPYDNDHCVSVFDNKEDAYKQACCEIVERINGHFDISNDADHKKLASEIQNHLDNSEYAKAVYCWNDSEVNADSDYAQYWYINDHKILNISPNVGRISNLNDDQDNDQAEEQSDEVNDTSATNKFVATECGANCRSCHNYNEYAYADCIEGTYECYGCRSIKNIFT